MARNYAALYHEYGDEMEALSDAEFGRLCRALIEYSKSGTPIALSGNERFYAKRVMLQEDRIQATYKKTCSERSEAGKKGAEARWGMANDDNEKQTMANMAKSKSKSKSISPNGDNNKRTRFTPPTADEVAAYCRERKNTVDPQRFIDYYTSNGWMVGKNHMKDWKAAVRQWESREKPAPKIEARGKTPFGGQPDPAVARAAYLKLCEELGEDPEVTA